MLIPHPNQYNIPHDEFRPGQYPALQFCLDADPGTVSIVEAATGSGKSALPVGCSSKMKTIILTATLQLQAQYKEYDAIDLKGKKHYGCEHPDRLFNDASCEECLHKGSMSECMMYSYCEYIIRREMARAARLSCLSYSMFNLTGNLRDRDGLLYWPRDFLFLDEAHDLSANSLNYYSVKVQPRTVSNYTLNELPLIPPGVPDGIKIKLALPWLNSCHSIVHSRVKSIEKQVKYSQDKVKSMKRLRGAQEFEKRLSLVKKALVEVPDDWYIKSDEEGFLAKPLTARHVFPKLFLRDRATRVVAMSATIGDFPNFAAELGIKSYRGHTVPSRFPPEQRRIYVHGDAPRMSSQATEADFEYQADLIAEIIKSAPSEWSGLVLVSRKMEGVLLTNRLKRRGLGDRVWHLPGVDQQYIPTHEQLEMWEERKRRVPNSICVTHSFGVGYDGRDERLLIIGKIPYPLWGSNGSFDEAWRKYSMARYYWTVVNLFIQWLGRTRRGNDGDYGDENGRVWVVDGSFGMIEGKLSDEIKAALVKVSSV